jgi:hypothetical protein
LQKIEKLKSEIELGLREVSLNDMDRFSKISGDTNKIHIDHNFAANSFAGSRIIHGTEVLLWALELFTAKFKEITWLRLEFRFLQYIKSGDSVRASCSNDLKILWVSIENLICLEIRIFQHDAMNMTIHDKTEEKIYDPKVRHEFSSQANLEQLRLNYPQLVEKYGIHVIRNIVDCSTIVGTVKPGEYSLYLSGITEIREKEPLEFQNSFKILKESKTLGYCKLNYATESAETTLIALETRKLNSISGENDLNNYVTPGMFKELNALVIGCSGGVGGKLSRLILHGGGKVLGTYHSNLSEMVSLKNQLTENEKMNFEFMKYDIFKDSQDLNASISSEINSIIYAATPKIVTRNFTSEINRSIESFTKFYSDIPLEMIKRLNGAPGNKIVFYNPSTEAIHQESFLSRNYIQAKLASEVALARKASEGNRITTYSPRLPLILSKQTNTFASHSHRDDYNFLVSTLLILREKVMKNW